MCLHMAQITAGREQGQRVQGHLARGHVCGDREWRGQTAGTQTHCPQTMDSQPKALMPQGSGMAPEAPSYHLLASLLSP